MTDVNHYLVHEVGKSRSYYAGMIGGMVVHVTSVESEAMVFPTRSQALEEKTRFKHYLNDFFPTQKVEKALAFDNN